MTSSQNDVVDDQGGRSQSRYERLSLDASRCHCIIFDFDFTFRNINKKAIYGFRHLASWNRE